VGATFKELSKSAVSRVEILLPPLEEQKRIADALEQGDGLLAKRRKAISLLDDLARSIFHNMFIATGGNHTDWPVRNISDLCTLVVDCVNRTAPTVDGPTSYKMIRTTNVRDGRVDLVNVRYVNSETFTRWNKRATPMPGDVILTREAPVGEAGILRSNERVFLGQRLMLYRVNEELLTPEYLLATFQGDFLAQQFEKFGSGSTVKHLPLPACRNFEIPLPPVALQRQYEDCMRELNAFRDSQKASLRHLNELLNSLEEKAFRGEL
jgi:type I restriction enzyme S subunit